MLLLCGNVYGFLKRVEAPLKPQISISVHLTGFQRYFNPTCLYGHSAAGSLSTDQVQVLNMDNMFRVMHIREQSECDVWMDIRQDSASSQGSMS